MRGIWRRRTDRGRWLRESLIGLAMIPLTFVPIWAYLANTDDGYLMYLRARYQLIPPGTPELSPVAARAASAARGLPVRGVPVLVYHGIGRVVTDSEDRRYLISRDHFAEQMGSLRAAGFTAITTRQLALYLRTGSPSTLPAKPVLVTFDDGRADAMLQADPILADTGMKAAMFVIGKPSEGGSFYYVDRGELRDFAETGRWELANHTYSLHQLLKYGESGRRSSALVFQRPGESLDAYRRRVATDLDQAQALLAREGGSEPIAFSYPYGDWGQHDAGSGASGALAAALRVRFQLAFDQDGQSGWRFALSGDDPLHIHRLSVEDWSGPELLARLAVAAELTEAELGKRRA